MIKNIKLSLLIGLLVSLVMLICGCDLGILKRYPQDNIVEEMAETIVENIAEDKLNLPPGSLDGKIDFSIFTPEQAD